MPDAGGRPSESAETGQPALRPVLEISIRLGVIALLGAACLAIIAPFLGIVVWALIIAVAADDANDRLCRALGGRRTLAAI